MKKSKTTIRKDAKAKYAKIKKLEKDPRFVKVIGKLIHAGLLLHTHISPSKETIELEDALFTGRLEPRIFELLPALLLKKPSFFKCNKIIPNDLKIIIKDIRRGVPTREFRGVPPKKYMYWLNFIGHENKKPTLLKSFRFSQNDLEILNYLKSKYNDSEISIIRRGIMSLAN